MKHHTLVTVVSDVPDRKMTPGFCAEIFENDGYIRHS